MCCFLELRLLQANSGVLICSYCLSILCGAKWVFQIPIWVIKIVSGSKWWWAFDLIQQLLKQWKSVIVMAASKRHLEFYTQLHTLHDLEWQGSLAYLFAWVMGICTPHQSPGAMLCLASWLMDPWDSPSSFGMEQAQRRMTLWAWHPQKCHWIKEVLLGSLSHSLSLCVHRVWTDTYKKGLTSFIRGPQTFLTPSFIVHTHTCPVELVPSYIPFLYVTPSADIFQTCLYWLADLVQF